MPSTTLLLTVSPREKTMPTLLEMVSAKDKLVTITFQAIKISLLVTVLLLNQPSKVDPSPSLLMPTIGNSIPKESSTTVDNNSTTESYLLVLPLTLTS